MNQHTDTSFLLSEEEHKIIERLEGFINQLVEKRKKSFGIEDIRPVEEGSYLLSSGLPDEFFRLYGEYREQFKDYLLNIYEKRVIDELEVIYERVIKQRGKSSDIRDVEPIEGEMSHRDFFLCSSIPNQFLDQYVKKEMQQE